MKWKRFLFPLIAAALFISLNSIDTYAETFSGEVNKVPAIESQVSFDFSFSLKQKYNITLIDPNGSYYNVSEDANKISVSVPSTVAGDYTYTIEANNTDFSYSVSAVESGRTILSVGDSKPTVSENVTDFKMWFEDGDVVATWNYSGKVKITITDPTKFNNLESGITVEGTSYRRKIPDNISKLQFYIVPATDAKIAGAGLTYTRDVVRQIAASVDFPKTDITKEDSVKLPISVDTGGVTLKIYDSGYEPGVSHHNDTTIKPVMEKKVDIGTYEIDIPLLSTNNTIVVAFIDESGNAVTKSYTYVRDMVAPIIDPKKISLDNKAIYTDYETTLNEVVISGIITDEIATNVVGSVKAFYIDGIMVDLDNSGRFSYTQPLTLGDNNIQLLAIDSSGLESDLTIKVRMLEKEKTPLAKYGLFLFAGVLIVLLVIYIIKKIKTTMEDRPERPTPPKPPKPTKPSKKTNSDADEEEKKKSIEERRRAEIERLQNGTPFGESSSKIENVERIEEPDDLPVKEEPVRTIGTTINPNDFLKASAKETVSEKKQSSAGKKNGNAVPILSQIDKEIAYEDMGFFERIKAKMADRAEMKGERPEKAKGKKEKPATEGKVLPVEEPKLKTVAASVASPKAVTFTFSEPVEEEYYDDEPLNNSEQETVSEPVKNVDAEIQETPLITEPERPAVLKETPTEGYVIPQAVAKPSYDSEKKTAYIPPKKETVSAYEIPVTSVTKTESKPVKMDMEVTEVNKYIEASNKGIKNKIRKEKPVEKIKRIQTNAILVRIAVQAAIILIFFSFVVRNTTIASSSMEPTLMTGDYALYNKLAYKIVDVQRGDIITFWSEEYKKNLSKRIIGISGDHIEFHDGYVFINGCKADESAYLPEDIETNCNRVFDVPDGCVFVLGDNRENSHDSRFFVHPYISEKEIIGKYIGTVKNPFRK